MHVFAKTVVLIISPGSWASNNTAVAIAMITDIQYNININTLHSLEVAKAIKMNDITRVKIRSTKHLFADD